MITTFANLVFGLGYAAIAYFVYRIYQFVTFYFFPSPGSLSRYQHKSEGSEWALVTGSSAGIGFGYAQELASRGFGVILLSHKPDELESAAQTIKTETPEARIGIVHLNAETAPNSEIEKALEPILDLPITILVNNVGNNPCKPTYKTFSEYSAADIDANIDVNARFMTQVTRILLPTLTKNSPSLILTMSSAGRVGLPWLLIYCASKAYNAAFGSGLARELRVLGIPIDSVVIIPGDTYSQGNVTGMAPGSPTSRAFAKMALDRVGMCTERKMLEMSPFWQHDLQIKILNVLPERLRHRFCTDMVRGKAGFADTETKR